MFKKIILALMPVFVSLALFAQEPEDFTITHEDMPSPTKDVEVRAYKNNSKLKSSATGNLGSIDLIMLGEGSPTSRNYYTEEDPFFADANMSLARKAEKRFVPGFIYYYASVFAFPGDGIYEAGIKLPKQSYPLTSFTGKSTDQLDIPEQHYILDDPKKLIEFPVQAGSNWSSESRRTTNFNLTEGAYGLKNVPAQHVWTVYREEKVVGYGKMRVYHPEGPSEYYEVLKSEVTEYAIDSFYLNGKPAPAALLKAFGAKQGQKISIDNRVNFYRKGHLNPLFSMYFGSDAFDKVAASLFADMNVGRPGNEEDEKIEKQSTGDQLLDNNLARKRK